MQHDLGSAKQAHCFRGQQVGVTGTCAHQVNLASHDWYMHLRNLTSDKSRGPCELQKPGIAPLAGVLRSRLAPSRKCCVRKIAFSESKLLILALPVARSNCQIQSGELVGLWPR